MQEEIRQALLELLGERPLKLGFGDAPTPTIVYVGRKEDCVWYTWDFEKDTHVPIKSTALTGTITKVETVEGNEYKGKTPTKLRVHINADVPYILQVGAETHFAQSLTQTLAKVPADALKNPIMIAVEASTKEEKVIFAKVFNPVSGKQAFVTFDRAIRIEDSIKVITEKLLS